MDQNNGNDDYRLRPPPYSSPVYNQTPYPGMSYEDRTGNIAVVGPPSGYDNTVLPEGEMAGGIQQSSEAPPDYSLGFVENNCFSEATVRRGFIRKVYLTLMIQLLVTVGIICAFVYWEALKKWTWDNNWFSYAMMAVVMVLIVLLSCCDNLRRRVPLNFIALGLFTVAEGLMLGSVTACFDAEAVLWAVGATALVSLSLTLFAMQSKWDFTTASGCLWVFGWTLISFALLCVIMRSKFVYIAYACLGTLIFSIAYLPIGLQFLHMHIPFIYDSEL